MTQKTTEIAHVEAHYAPALLEELNRIVVALEAQNEILESQANATISVSNRLEDLQRFMG